MQNSEYLFNVVKRTVEPLMKSLAFDRKNGTAHGPFLLLAPQIKARVERLMDPEMCARICASDTLTFGPSCGTGGFIRKTCVRDVLLKDISTKMTSKGMLQEIVVAIIVGVAIDIVKQSDYQIERAKEMDTENDMDRAYHAEMHS